MREFELPDVGEGVAEGELVEWLVAVDDTVTEDQPVAEVETDKAIVEVPSPVDGTVAELHAEAGDVVPVGDVLVTFAVAGEDDEARGTEPAGDDAGTGGAAEDVREGTAADGEIGGSDAGTADAPAGNGETPGSGRVFAPPSVRRLARELGVDIATVSGSGPGGRVTEGDVRAADDDVPPEGSAATDEVDDPLGDEGRDGESAAGTADGSARETGDAGTGATLEASVGDVEPAGRDRTLAVPATRGVARESGVEIDDVPAVERRDDGAFVDVDAVRAYAEAQRAARTADAEAVHGETTGVERESIAEGAAAGASGAERAAADASGAEASERETREPYRGIRRTIGRAMVDSKRTAPHVTHHDEVDVTELVATRERLKSVAEERGTRLTYVPFVMKACVAALRQYPIVNASLDDEADEIVKKRYYNLGVATATDAGLMVPVVDDVDRKGLLEIADETDELVAKARDRSIAREEMQGGTFTVTNVGGIGGEYATPIINHPEVAILALGEIREKPRVVDGEVVPRHVLPLSLSFDHRIIDGAIGARFTNAVKEPLREPERLLL